MLSAGAGSFAASSLEYRPALLSIPKFLVPVNYVAKQSDFWQMETVDGILYLCENNR